MAGPATPIDGEPWTSDEVDEATQQIIDHNAALANLVGNRTLTQLEDDLSGAFAKAEDVAAAKILLGTPGVLDEFDRPNGAIGSATVGGAWTSRTVANTLGIYNGVATSLFESGTTDEAIATLGVSWFNLDLTGRAAMSINFRPAIYFRWADNDNHLRVSIRRDGEVVLSKRLAGVSTNLATVAASSSLTVARRSVRVLAIEDMVWVFLDGHRVIAHTLDPGDVTALPAGAVGLGAQRSSPSQVHGWDSLVGRSLA